MLFKVACFGRASSGACSLPSQPVEAEQDDDAYIALWPSGAAVGVGSSSSSPPSALVLPHAIWQRLPPGYDWAGDAAETSGEEEDEEEEGEDPSLPSTPPSAVSCLAAVAPAPGDILRSAVSGRAYLVLRTIAGANVGHRKKRTSILLAAPMVAGAKEGGAAPVVIKVIEQAAYMQRYGAAAAAPTSGRAIGEVAAHHRLAHAADPAVLPLLEAMADERCIYMVFPYADGPDAFDAVAATPRGLPEAEARRYFIDMALGVLHLKKHGVSHGDLSLENAVLSRRPDGGFACHLIDLEMARLVVDGGVVSATTLAAAQFGLSHAGGKPGYVSPEGAYGTVLDWHAADAWSLGICLYIMLTARPLYSHPDDRAFEILACGGAPSLLHHYATEYGLALPEGATELITALLRPDPIDRPTIEEVLLHPWVRPVLARVAGKEGIPQTEAGMEKHE